MLSGSSFDKRSFVRLELNMIKFFDFRSSTAHENSLIRCLDIFLQISQSDIMRFLCLPTLPESTHSSYLPKQHYHLDPHHGLGLSGL